MKKKLKKFLPYFWLFICRKVNVTGMCPSTTFHTFVISIFWISFYSNVFFTKVTTKSKSENCCGEVFTHFVLLCIKTYSLKKKKAVNRRVKSLSHRKKKESYLHACAMWFSQVVQYMFQGVSKRIFPNISN